jgi:urease accessory protein
MVWEQPPGQPGHGLLTFEHQAGKTVVTQMTAHAPLKWLHPRNHGQAAWVFSSSFGGGLVDRDHLHFQVNLGPSAIALLGTQASTKVYPAIQPGGEGSSQRFAVQVGDAAWLIALPDPITCYRNAIFRQNTTISLEPQASLLWLESWTSGRIARQESWEFELLSAQTSIDINHQPWVREHLLLSETHGNISERFRKFHAWATLFIVGPSTIALQNELANAARWPKQPYELLWNYSPISGGGVLRIAGHRNEDLQSCLRSLLRNLPEMIGDDPWARKW